MTYDGYKLLHVAREGRVVTATIDNPPINLMTLDLVAELRRLSEELQADTETTVFVLKSANPDFFIAHFDVTVLVAMAGTPPAPPEALRDNQFHRMVRSFALMDKATIAQIEGRVGGGGSELSMNFDMRFGVRGKTVVNQMEVPLGILPGGSGTQLLPRLIGRGRAMEVILGGVDMKWDDAERWGYLNRVFEPGDIGPFVEALARRIASFPPDAVRLAKRSVNASALDLEDGLVEESLLFSEALHSVGARRNMARFLEIGGQTHAGEMKVAELSTQLGEG